MEEKKNFLKESKTYQPVNKRKHRNTNLLQLVPFTPLRENTCWWHFVQVVEISLYSVEKLKWKLSHCVSAEFSLCCKILHQTQAALLCL